MKRWIVLVLLIGGLPLAEARAVDFEAAASAVRELLGELVAANTSNPPGNEARAVAIGAARLDALGIDTRVSRFGPGRENLVARLRGDGSAPPLLLLAHVDVVGAEGQSWSSDPHRMVAVDGYLVGRGVADDLGMAAVELVVLELLKREGVPLARDVILAWTGDEESGGGGIRWLLEHDPQQIEAALVINEGGGIRLGEDGAPSRIELQTAEKVYQDFELVARGTTGHSSVPLPDNAIDRLARGLVRIGDHRFPPRLLPVTRAYFEARVPLESGERRRAMQALVAAPGAPPAEALAVLDADPTLAASLRTTCVATMLSGGTRANALPAEARAHVNCRILPDRSVESLQAQLIEIVDDPGIEVRPTREFGHGVPSPLDGPGPDAIRALAEAMWPGIPVIPFMSRGATDSRFARAHGMTAYGISPIAIASSDARRAHGIDERIPEASLRPAVEFLYRLVLALAAREGDS